MKRRRTPSPEALERARQDAQRTRVEAGLPAEDPEGAEFEAQLAATRKAAKRKSGARK